MARYIDADKLITKIEKLYHDAHIQWNMKDIAERTKNFWCGQTSAFNRSRNIIIDFPTADVVEVKHGYWIPVPSSDMSTGKAYKCSECKIMRYGCRLPPYCQECGAKMDLKDGVNND